MILQRHVREELPSSPFPSSSPSPSPASSAPPPPPPPSSHHHRVIMKQRHTAFTPACFALPSGTAPRKRTSHQGRTNPCGTATSRATSPHGLPTHQQHVTHHPAHQRHAFTLACFALPSGTAPRTCTATKAAHRYSGALKLQSARLLSFGPVVHLSICAPMFSNEHDQATQQC